MSVSDTMAICALASRYGAWSYMTRLQFVHFPPTNPVLEAKCSISSQEWIGTPWIVAILPVEFSDMAQKIAREFGMALREGVPEARTEVDKPGELFPLSTRHSKTFHLISRERPVTRDVPYALESQQMQQIIEEAGKLHQVDFNDFSGMSWVNFQALDNKIAGEQSRMIWKNFGSR